MTVRTIGIDLAVTAAHKAIVLDCTSNSYVGSLIQFHTDPVELVLQRDISWYTSLP